VLQNVDRRCAHETAICAGLPVCNHRATECGATTEKQFLSFLFQHFCFPRPLIDVNAPNFPIRLVHFGRITFHPFVARTELFSLLGTIKLEPIPCYTTTESGVENKTHALEMISGAIRTDTYRKETISWRKNTLKVRNVFVRHGGCEGKVCNLRSAAWSVGEENRGSENLMTVSPAGFEGFVTYAIPVGPVPCAVWVVNELSEWRPPNFQAYFRAARTPNFEYAYWWGPIPKRTRLLLFCLGVVRWFLRLNPSQRTPGWATVVVVVVDSQGKNKLWVDVHVNLLNTP